MKYKNHQYSRTYTSSTSKVVFHPFGEGPPKSVVLGKNVDCVSERICGISTKSIEAIENFIVLCLLDEIMKASQ